MKKLLQISNGIAIIATEAYFAEKLLDYELSSNNGNWQWAAGTGCDAAPYFRIFNPHGQLKRFDLKLVYIKKWKFISRLCKKINLYILYMHFLNSTSRYNVENLKDNKSIQSGIMK